MLTLGSLFSGIGGFELAGVMCGITPVWSSEIEPFPLKVTAARFPGMIQLGSVTDIDGGKIKPVDIITFGSPCQDLSVAGKQLGIHDGQRSNLFFEAVRIIKEMRAADERIGRTGEHVRPRFAVWENVPGAFSSNKGADFKAVLEALAGVREDGVSIPQPKKWGGAGAVVGDGWSLAWRVYDAQYWGVPQRRKRIYLVADFAGERAGEILFERESVRGNPTQGRETREGTAADGERGVGGSGCVRIAAFMGGQGAKARSIAWCDDGTTPTLKAALSGGNTVPDVCYPINTMVATRGGRDDMRTCFGIGEPGDPQFTISAAHEHGVCYAIQSNMVDRDTNQNGPGYMTDNCPTLNTVDRYAVCYPETARTLAARHDSSPCVDRGQNVIALDCRNMTGNEELSGTLQAKNEGGFSLNFVNPVVYVQQRIGKYTEDTIGSTEMARDYKSAKDLIVESSNPPRKYIVRRLTPTECARLQGFPDWWCDGLGGSDSAIYKAYGNGLALPCAYDVMQRIARFVEREKEEKQVG